jgi:hypothetical protein
MYSSLVILIVKLEIFSNNDWIKYVVVVEEKNDNHAEMGFLYRLIWHSWLHENSISCDVNPRSTK